jgi:hypothetical protein
VDLRWISTRVVRPISYQRGFAARPTGLPVSVHPDAVREGAAGADEAESVSGTQSGEAAPYVVPTGAAAASAVQGDVFTTVLAMLRVWEKNDHATR